VTPNSAVQRRAERVRTVRCNAYIKSTRDEHVDNALVRMHPERWLTVDFATISGSP